MDSSVDLLTAPPTGTETMFAEVLAEVLHVDRVPADSDFFDDLGADSMVMAQFCARVRKRPDLPAVSIKDIYQHPTIGSLATALAPPPGAPVEAMFAEVLAEVLHVDRVPVDSHFFDDLGADSMVMAQFCARVRKRPDLPSVSIKDIYQHPTIGSLATALAGPTPAPVQPPAPAPAVTRAGTRQYVLCGALQVLVFLGYAYLTALVLERGFRWISARRRSGHRLPPGGGGRRRRSSSACAPCRSWRSGCSSAGGSPSRSASGAWRTSASGWSRRWSGPTRWSCSSVRRSTCCICGRWARRSGAAS